MSNILRCPDIFEVGAKLLYSNRGDPRLPHIVDALLTPVLHAFNNSDRKINLMFNDPPKLMHREYLVKTLKKNQIEDLLQEYLTSIRLEDESFDFNPQLMIPEAFIHPKVAYITETLRQSCFTSKKIMAVVEKDYVDLIQDEWGNLPKDIRDIRETYFPKIKPV